MRLSSWLVCTMLVYSVRSESLKGTPEQIIIYSCQSVLSGYNFDCDGAPWLCSCSYEPILGSITECIETYLKGNKHKAYNNLIKSCAKNARVDLTLDHIREVNQNATNYIVSPNDDNFDVDELHHVPILPAESKILTKTRDYQAFLGNIDDSQYFGIMINLYFVGVLSLFALFNRMKRSSRLNNRLVGDHLNLIRSNVSLPLLSDHHFQPYEYVRGYTTLLPTNAEGLVLAGYFILHTVALVANIEIYSSNTIFGKNLMAQLLRYIADRSGILSFTHFPLIVLFAGRNNLLISFTGLPFSSFMIFHKWIARIMFVDAFIHTILYSIVIYAAGTFKLYLSEVWYQTGFIAFVVGIVILGFAIHNFRARFYEFFLLTHIVLAFIFFIACIYHCAKFGWLDWIYASLCFWALDRVLRLIKLFKFGAPMANIEFISDETFKVTVQRPSDWQPFPGCFVYIHFLHPTVFYQSHPFTIVDSVLNDQEVTIYIKAKEGLTKRVLGLIGHGKTSMRVSLEGPYGNQSPADSFDNVILFAGGNGIPGPFYHALHLAHTPLLPKRRVRLLWVIRQVETIQWFEQELKQLAKTKIECDIYITRNFNEKDVSSIPLLSQFSDYITFHSGRSPNEKILYDELTNAQGSIGIVTCGPPIMCDNVRDYVSKNLDQCRYRVDLFEELQVW